NPTVSGYTRQDLLIWQGVVATALENAAVGPEDILQISLDPGLDNWGRDYKSGAETIGASVIPNTLLSIEKQLMVMRDYKPSVLVTTPSYARQVALHLDAGQQKLTDFNLKTLILVGEPADPTLRRFLEKALNVSCWQHFGLSEVPGPALAYECKHHSCLHVNDEHFLPEIIAPESGAPVPPGAVGELVLTTLTTRAFPLIRFRTGDRARMVTEPCSCDCRLARIEWLPERTDHLVCIRGVKVHRQQVLAAVENALGFKPQDCCLFENRYEEKVYLEIWVAVEDAFFSDAIKMLENRMKTIRNQVQEDTGVPVVVRLKERGTIEAGPSV
ncbi:MAG: AMP-binding protein, partial [Desulfosarcina sp.]|nr:AMP-binding protein [Desulfobacterales bacterium]